MPELVWRVAFHAGCKANLKIHCCQTNR
jgi:hypothetical protein